MSTFVRVFIGRTTNQVHHVVEQDVPFENAGRSIRDSHQELDAVDLGFVEHHDWRDLEGAPCTPSMHIFLRLEKDHSDMPEIHDCPCTMNGIEARLRAQGPSAIPVKARAWLANILPPEKVTAWGIGRGLPISAMKAAEAIRNKRDPAGGSRMPILNAIAHAQQVALRTRIERRAGRAFEQQQAAAAVQEE